jgi:hypothetical protein
LLTEQYAEDDPHHPCSEQQLPKVDPMQDVEWEAPQDPFVLVVIELSPLEISRLARTKQDLMEGPSPASTGVEIDTPHGCPTQAMLISPFHLHCNRIVIIIPNPLVVPRNLLDHRIGNQFRGQFLRFDNLLDFP